MQRGPSVHNGVTTMTRRLLHDPRPRLLLALAVLCPDLPGVPQDGQDGAPVAVVTETHTHLGERPLAPVPVTLSRVGCPGDFTEGITPLVDGRALPAQVDVLARNADNSIRHALVSFVLPPAADAPGDGWKRACRRRTWARSDWRYRRSGPA